MGNATEILNPVKVTAFNEQFLLDVIEGLSSSPKRIASKYFYDTRGSELFEEITRQPEYYPTLTELSIMKESSPVIAKLLGSECLLIEYGSGSSLKTRLLLRELEKPAGYVPVEISEEFLMEISDDLKEEFPHLPVQPVAADFTGDFSLPQTVRNVRRKVVYFPGSTIGNFTPDQAAEILDNIAGLVGRGGGLVIGIDLEKDRSVLEKAYNDAAGVTAEFNMNLLRRMNRETGADFNLSKFQHRAFYNRQRSRIEMHLVSLARQSVNIDGNEFNFEAGESIHTENSYKYSFERFLALAGLSGFKRAAYWVDRNLFFSVQYFIIG